MKLAFPADSLDTPIGLPAEVANQDVPFGSPKAFPGDAAPAETDGAEPGGDGGDDDAPEPEAAEAEQVDPLIEEAEHYGFSKEDALAIGADKLPTIFAQLDRQAAAFMRRQEGEPEPEATPVPAPKAEATPSIEPLFKPLDQIKVELDAADYDEPMVKQLTSFANTINAAIERINKHQEGLQMVAEAVVETHGQQQKLVGETQSQSEAKFADAMDTFFAEQAELKATFGTAPMALLTPGSAEVTARMKLVEEMKILEAGDRHFGRPVRSPQQYATRALRVLHGEKTIAAARKDVAGDLAKRRKQAIAQPSGRNRKLSGREAALAFLSQSLGN